MRPRALRRRRPTIIICLLDRAKARRSGESCDSHHCSDWQMVKGWIRWWWLHPILGDKAVNQVKQQGILKHAGWCLTVRFEPMWAGCYTQDVRFILRSITQMPHKICQHQPGGCGNSKTSKQALITKCPVRLDSSIKRAFRIQGGHRQQQLGSAQWR